MSSSLAITYNTVNSPATFVLVLVDFGRLKDLILGIRTTFPSSISTFVYVHAQTIYIQYPPSINAFESKIAFPNRHAVLQIRDNPYNAISNTAFKLYWPAETRFRLSSVTSNWKQNVMITWEYILCSIVQNWNHGRIMVNMVNLNLE